MFKRTASLALVACAVSTFAGAYAQSATDGAIGGTVEDKSGAIVGNATVTIRNLGTNAEQKLTSDNSGYFRAIHLQPGSYSVTIAATGFEAFKSTDVTVQNGLVTTVEPRLTIGAATETVEVTSAAPDINTTNNDFSNTIGLKVLEDLPVNNYRWSAYTLLTPGVVEGGGFGLLSFRGQSTVLNNITFDGADDNQAFFSEERGRTRAGYSTAKSSILEFQVNTSNYSTEYGRSAGGVVNAVTKSGTNQFHGEAYFYDRDAEYGASNPFTFHAVSDGNGGYPLSVFKPKDKRQQEGIGVGGPIIKDKLFFFFAFDEFHHNFPGVSGVANPGLFYKIPDATIPGGTCVGTSAAGTTDSKGNVVLAPTVDGAVCQLAVNLNKLGSLATVTQAQYTAALGRYNSGIAGINSITGLTPRTGDQSIFFPKIDFQLNPKNHITAEVNRLRWKSPAGIQTNTSVLNYGIESFGNDYVNLTFGVAKLDTLITSHLSNEVRYQYGRDREFEFNQVPTGYENSTLLNTGANSTAPNYVNPYGIPPLVQISNALSSGLGTATFLNRPNYPDERRQQITDTANYVRGNHSFKFGIDYLHTDDLSQNLQQQYGSYSYGGSNYAPFVTYFTDLNTTNGCGGSLTSHTQECWQSYAQGLGPLGFEFVTGDYAGFFQDEWKVKPRLSLTLGVRYEYERTPAPQLPNLANEAVRPFNNGSTNVFPDNRNNVGPRVGFAFDVFGDGKTALRGGYGEFFARLENSTIYNAIAQTGTPQAQQQLNFSASTAQGAPTVFPVILNPATAAPIGTSNTIYFDKNFKLPEVHQADLTLEQALGYKTTLSLTWLASFGRRLPDFVDTNLPAPNTTVTYVYGAGGPVPTGTSITIPYYKALNVASGCQGTKNVYTPAAPTCNGRPDSRYGSTTDIFSGVNSNYEALVFSINHQTTRNLSFSANYTWSHALDYGENDTTFSNTNSLFDPRNIRAEYGNSNHNIPNRLIMYAVYNTPSTFHGALGYLLNNYEIAPSFQAQNGNPYSAGLTGSSTGLVLNDGTKLGTGSAVAGNNNSPASGNAGVNGSGGTGRAPGTDRNIFSYRRVLVIDARISKRFRVMDRADVELLAEAFNLANHLNQTGVSSTAAYQFNNGTVANGAVTAPNVLSNNASSFGVFDPTRFLGSANNNLIYTPRQVQGGIRVQF